VALTYLQRLDDDAHDEYNRKAADNTWNELDVFPVSAYGTELRV